MIKVREIRHVRSKRVCSQQTDPFRPWDHGGRGNSAAIKREDRDERVQQRGLLSVFTVHSKAEG